ncbi:MAG: tRNA (adenosine(37)-N6)-threonylcarbamoyltransferase complex transferase subunit TsaD [Alphaproteobacteria bacterium]|nr:tRNA (adenosine(37)-N6)-threonylcarbamoyltransferase complex transferase subunit TsaD [Alphaproteobacteria bacterium]
MRVLGIESSCDETAAAIVSDKKELLSSVVFSQAEHQIFGGVVPEIAARAHLQQVGVIVKAALDQAGLTFKDLDAVAASSGPGLIGGVIVGVMTAKAIAAVHNLPFIAVNHLEAHALTARLTQNVPFPYLLLLTSGGHCQILIAQGIGKFKRLGATVDDAAGEAFDKAAKMMGLGYPGGPKIEQYALSGDENRFELPRPMVGKPGCDLSFSGLKTAVRHIIEGFSPDGTIENAVLSEQDKADLCACFQKAVLDSLCSRLKNGIKLFKKQCPQGTHLVVAGGVAANKALRQALEKLVERYKLTFAAAPMNLCTDNGAMVAWAGMERCQAGLFDPLDFSPRPRWPLDPSAKR